MRGPFISTFIFPNWSEAAESVKSDSLWRTSPSSAVWSGSPPSLPGSSSGKIQLPPFGTPTRWESSRNGPRWTPCLSAASQRLSWCLVARWVQRRGGGVSLKFETVQPPAVWFYYFTLIQDGFKFYSFLKSVFSGWTTVNLIYYF